ncbi:unnamed protein product [Peniophora sp. CBMAI 1063]|nr:unnamed protein product [Peniophora sp. CBMAI 1063]
MGFPLRPVPSGCDDKFDWSKVKPIKPLKVPGQEPPALVRPCINATGPRAPYTIRKESTPERNRSHGEEEYPEETAPTPDDDWATILNTSATSREQSISLNSTAVATTEADDSDFDELASSSESRHASASPTEQEWYPTVTDPGSAILDAEHGLYRPFAGASGVRLLHNYSVERTLSPAQIEGLNAIRTTKRWKRRRGDGDTKDSEGGCPLCRETFSNRANLVVHLYQKSHLDVRFRCDFCDAVVHPKAMPDHVQKWHVDRKGDYKEMLNSRKPPAFNE